MESSHKATVNLTFLFFLNLLQLINQFFFLFSTSVNSSNALLEMQPVKKKRWTSLNNSCRSSVGAVVHHMTWQCLNCSSLLCGS